MARIFTCGFILFVLLIVVNLQIINPYPYNRVILTN